MALKTLIVPVTQFQQNCSIIWCEDTLEGAIVDPGGDIPEILNQAKSQDIDIKQILLTHAHIDHAGGTQELATQLDIPIIGPQKEDQFWIDSLPTQSQMFGFPHAAAFTPTRWLEDNDEITIGNCSLKVIHTPGHTPGHVVFYHPESKLAIVGDVLFQGSIGRTDFPKGDFDTLIASIKEKLWPLGNDVAFIPGHGPMSTFGDERHNNPFVKD